jgi:hypothetical protein
MTMQSKRGGRRDPPGGRPPKGNERFVCYIPPYIIEEIDKSRGTLTRGEFIAGLVGGFVIKQSDEKPAEGKGGEEE